MKSMCKHWGLHISTNINCLGAVLGSFWAVWRGLFWCLKAKLISWQFPRYWWFNKQYHSGYQLICLISRPILITLRRDWYRLKGLFKGFLSPLRPRELSKNWWRYGQMKFVTLVQKLWRRIPKSCVHGHTLSTWWDTGIFSGANECQVSLLPPTLLLCWWLWAVGDLPFSIL